VLDLSKKTYGGWLPDTGTLACYRTAADNCCFDAQQIITVIIRFLCVNAFVQPAFMPHLPGRVSMMKILNKGGEAWFASLAPNIDQIRRQRQSTGTNRQDR
jgi:hypothetical protein